MAVWTTSSCQTRAREVQDVEGETEDGGLAAAAVVAAAGAYLQNDAAVTLSSLLSVSLTWNKGGEKGPRNQRQFC